MARQRIESIGEPYKLEILDSILRNTPDAPITIYHIGEAGEKDHWWDLCAGPHVASTGAINADAMELESVAGAYWRGDEQAAQLQRVYGTAWETRRQLDAYKHLKAEAIRRWSEAGGREAGACVVALERNCPRQDHPCAMLLKRVAWRGRCVVCRTHACSLWRSVVAGMAPLA